MTSLQQKWLDHLQDRADRLRAAMQYNNSNRIEYERNKRALDAIHRRIFELSIRKQLFSERSQLAEKRIRLYWAFRSLAEKKYLTSGLAVIFANMARALEAHKTQIDIIEDALEEIEAQS